RLARFRLRRRDAVQHPWLLASVGRIRDGREMAPRQRRGSLRDFPHFVQRSARRPAHLACGRPRPAACPPLSGRGPLDRRMAPPLLTLDGITLTFGGTPLLEGAELSVSAGDRIALVGRNGSGKSTLLKIAAGIVEPQEGEVFRHPTATVRYLAQAPDMEGHATVRSYVEQGLGPADDINRVALVLDRLGLTGEEAPSSLSGGEARRAALARVLVPEPDILLLDEPTNHLDLTTIEWLEEELSRTS